MVDIVYSPTSLTQRQEVTHHFNNVLPGEHPYLKGKVETELGIQFQSTNAREIVTFRVKKQVIKEQASRIFRGNIAWT